MQYFHFAKVYCAIVDQKTWQRARQASVSSPLYESHPAQNIIQGRANHQHSTSELTSESSITSFDEADDTQRLEFSQHHQTNPSLSSMGSDHNLFGFEEDSANTSSISIPANIVSEQSTPVLMRRAARLGDLEENGRFQSPKDHT